MKRQRMIPKPAVVGIIALTASVLLVEPVELMAQTASRSAQLDAHVRSAEIESTELTVSERARATVWALSEDEWRRYRSLMQGVRGSVSPASLSPIEVLGIHARNTQERRQYAEQWARMMREDAERILAFQHAYDEAQSRLYPQSQLIDALKVAMRPSKASTETDAALKPTDRVLFFTATDCGACDVVLDRLLAKRSTFAGIDLYLLDVAVGEEDRIRRWAESRNIDPRWVHERRVTLNRDGGALARLTATTGGRQDAPPVVLRRRNDAISSLSTAQF